jgi:hypothetical protein
VHIDADAAAIDLTGAQVDQFEQLFRKAFFGHIAKRLQHLHGVWNNHSGVIHTGLHHFTLHAVSSVLTRPRRFAVTSAGFRSS